MEAPVQLPERLITAEEFYELFAGGDFELVKGRVVHAESGEPLNNWYTRTAQALQLPVGDEAMDNPTHGMLCVRLASVFDAYLEGHPVGKCVLNTGFVLQREPDVTRGPDMAFVSNQRRAVSPAPERGFWEVVPELVVEVVSPRDWADAVMEKVQAYLHYGVSTVWVVYPRQRQVQVFRSGKRGEILSGPESLTGDDVLPGFELPLQRLWAVLD